MANSKKITGLVPGSYNVFVKNSDGSCERAYPNNPVQVAGAGSIVINSVNTVAPTNCDTLTANGQITINATGGTGVKYSINGGTTFVTTNVFSNLRAGTYNIVVSKSDGSCPVSYQPVVLATPSGITISNVATTKPTVCGLSNGAITIAVTPSGTYQYSINGGQTFQSSATFSNLMQGNYSIVVKSTTTGCAAYYSTNPLVLSPQSCPEICNDGVDNDGMGGIDNCPDATCSLTPIQVQVTQTNCQTNAKGIININTAHVYKTCAALSAGAIKFTYYDKSAGAFQFSFVPLVNIAGGTSLIFTDKGWVNSTIGFWSGEGIIQWTAPTAGILAGTKVDIVGVEVFGSYLVSTTTGTVKKDNNVPNAAAYGSNLNFNLSGSGDQIIALCGTSFAIGDLGNLVFLAAINANATTWNAGGATTDKTSAIPPGLTNGTTAVAVGNTSSWSTTAPTIDNTISYSINGGETFQASGTFSNLNPGFYKVVVKKGSCLTAYSSNPVQIYGCSELCNDGIDNDGNGKADCLDVACSVGSVAVTPTLPACVPASTLGKISISLSPNTGGSYQYSINNGTTWKTSALFDSLVVGNYQVKVKRVDNGCEATFATNPVVLPQPTCVEICNDGYDNDEDTFIDCDDSDCGAKLGDFLVTNVQPVCPANSLTGKITIAHKFSSPNYQYSINGGQSFQADTLFANLASGSYQVLVKNVSSGCVVSLGAPVVLQAPNCPEICNNTIDDDGDGQMDCADTDCGVPSYAVEFIRPDCPPEPITGSITITPFGAAAAYQYSKDNGSTWQSSPIFSNLQEGDYQIVLKRISSGCTLAYSGNPIVLRRYLCQEVCDDGIDNDLDDLIDCADPDCNVPEIEETQTNPPLYCYNNDGIITVIAVAAGSGPGVPSDWEYSKDNGATWQDSNVFGGLAVGTYTLKVRNKVTGCQVPEGSANASATVTLQSLNTDAGILVSVEPTPSSFCNDNDGKLIVTATSGTPPYQYRLNGGTWSNNNIFSNLSSGNYVIEVAANGGRCISSTSVALPKRADITITNVTSNRNCTAESGTIQIAASTTESLALEYSINNGSTWSDTPDFTNLAAGTYTIAVRYKTDTRCVKNYATAVVIQEFVPITISQVNPTATTKCDANDGMLTVIATGNGILEYRITSGQWQTSNQFRGLAPESYDIYARYTDYPDTICQAFYRASPVKVNPPILPSINNITSTNPTSCAAEDGTIIVSPSSVENYMYSVNGGQSFQDVGIFTNLGAGSYNVVVKIKGNNCDTK